MGGRGLRVALALVAAGVTALSAIPSADAARRPAPGEAAAIKKVAMRACPSVDRDCRYRGARVSTRNARFAWGRVIGEGVSGVLLKRRTAHSRRFRAIGFQGGGIGECSYWRRRAPAPVLRDLRIVGLVDNSGTTANCGRRR